MNKGNISAMSFEHSSWLRALDFYKQELNILRERLTEVAGKNTGKDTAGQTEHFENQVTVQNENIDTLRHNINENLARSASQAQENKAGYIDADLIKKHEEQRDQFLAVEKVVNELRKDFNVFAAKWM